MPKERKKLRQTEKDLLEFSAGDLIPMLENDKKLLHVRQGAFEHYSAGGELFQVHVIVTRNESDFLEPFQTEEMNGY